MRIHEIDAIGLCIEDEGAAARFIDVDVIPVERDRVQIMVAGSPPRAWGRRRVRRVAAIMVISGSPPRAWGRRMAASL